MNKINCLMLTVFLCLNFYQSFSQQNPGDTLATQIRKDGIIKFIRLKEIGQDVVTDATSFFKKLLPMGVENEFREVRNLTDNKGFNHITFQQYFKGVLVAGGRYQVNGKDGKFNIAYGDFKRLSNISTTPALDENAALEKALLANPCSVYKWQDSAYEKLIREVKNDDKASFRPQGELLLFSDSPKDEGKKFRLTWKFIISTLAPVNDDYMVMVDAQNGKILQSVSINNKSNTSLAAQTVYSGSQSITGDSYTGGYRLFESRYSTTVHTLNLNGTDNFTSATEFSNSNTTFDLSNWTDYGSHKYALDVHWAMEKVLDYYENVLGRNSIDGNGLAVTGYVHYLPGSSSHYNNDIWIDAINAIAIGDGDGSIMNPLVSLDFCAHELGHGLQRYTSNLQLYHSGPFECSALNEGLSDIWGAVIENWATTGKSTWKMGEDFILGGKTSGRNLENPKDGNAYQPGPDTYQGTNWSSINEPHINSMILSHWFYLLSQGGYGTNDNSTNYNVSGIGITDAASIVWQAESQHLQPDDDYDAMRTASILSAQEVFGTGSCQEIAVINAWSAVGIGDPYFNGTSISGAGAVCSVENYTLTNAPIGANLTWNVTPINIATLSQTGNTATLTKNTGVSGSVTLSVSPTGGCGVTIPNSGKNIAIGNSVAGTYDVISNYYSSSGNTLNNGGGTGGGSVFTRSNQTVQFYVNLDQGQSITSPSWSASGSYFNLNSSGTTASLYMVTPTVAWTANNATLTFTGTGACGNINESFNFQAVSTGTGYFAMMASPNPANGNINVSIANVENTSVMSQEDARIKYEKMKNKKTKNETTIRLYDFYTNSLVKQWKYSEVDSKSYKLNIVGVKHGVYVLTMERNELEVSTKIIIN